MKIYSQDTDVLHAAKNRMEFIFDNYECVVVSYSGGKDSTVLLQLAKKEAIKRDRKIYALFVDPEAQYNETILQIERAIISDSYIIPIWVCIPLLWRNGLSVFQPHWKSWDITQKQIWVRDYPNYDCVVKDESVYPFYNNNFGIDDFVIEFPKWFCQQNGYANYASLVGIRADESFHRYTAIKGKRKKNYLKIGNQKIKWSTIPSEKFSNIVNLYPIYDWHVSDIWKYIYDEKLPYNKIYDLMYLAGTPLVEQRICQPYGDEQRRGLDLWAKIEPDTWHKALNRVSGVNMGAIYAGQKMLGYKQSLGVPDGYTWKTYTFFLLSTLPETVREKHLANFAIALEWYMKERYYDNVSEIPENDTLIDNPSGFNIPSWRKFCLAIIKNDFWGNTLDIGITKYPNSDIYESVDTTGHINVRISVKPFYEYLCSIYNDYVRTGKVEFDFVHPTVDRNTAIKEKWLYL